MKGTGKTNIKWVQRLQRQADGSRTVMLKAAHITQKEAEEHGSDIRSPTVMGFPRNV